MHSRFPHLALVLLAFALQSANLAARDDRAGIAPGENAPNESIRVAVASNFKAAARALAARYELSTGTQVILLFGSTGKHVAQISNGAPVDVFLSADSARVARLESAGKTVPGTRFVYAIGKLVLWSSKPGLVDADGDILRSPEFRHIAIANPRLAPYGKAAMQVLESLELKDSLSGRMVRGENIEQAFQYVSSGNAELGFVANSQLAKSIWGSQGSSWEVPQELYAPIEQEAVLINDTRAAREFLGDLRSDAARKIIRDYGYGTP